MPQLTADSSYLYPSLCRKNYQHSSNSNSVVQVLSPAELLILASTKRFGGKIKVAANILPLLHPFDYSLFKVYDCVMILVLYFLLTSYSKQSENDLKAKQHIVRIDLYS